MLQTERLWLPSRAGIVGYAGAITRGPISFLTDLFVDPSHQSSQLGKALLQAALPPDHLTLRCTVSSSDPRAQALYIRAGMVPQWPSFALRLEDPARAWPTPADIEISEAAPDDPALLEWDAQISGRPRPLEHRYWVRKEQAVPLWFQRQQQRVGYGYIRLNAEALGSQTPTPLAHSACAALKTPPRAPWRRCAGRPSAARSFTSPCPACIRRWRPCCRSGFPYRLRRHLHVVGQDALL